MKGHTRDFYFQPEFTHKLLSFLIIIAISVVIILIIHALCLLYNQVKLRKSVINAKIVTIILIFIATLFSRIWLILIYKGNIQPYSDFNSTWNMAIGNMAPLSYYRFFPAHMNYALMEKIISHITGKNYTIILYWCVLCNSITNAFIFLIAEEIFKNYKLSILASMLYLFNPSSIVYVLTSTNEHMAIACFFGSVYFICKYWDTDKFSCKILFIIIAGILGGIGNSVKTFFPVIIIGFAIMQILRIIKENNLRGIKSLSKIILCVMLLFLSQKFVANGITITSEKIFNTNLNFADATPHYLNVGLNRQGEGQIHVGNISRLYITDRTNGLPLYEAKTIAVKRVIDDWNGNIKKIPAFLIKKTIWAWQDNIIPLINVSHCELQTDTPIKSLVYKAINTIGMSYTQLWYMLSMFLGTIGILLLLKSNSEMNNYKFSFSNLILLGYFCLTIVSESQSRYKCLILPCLCIINAYSILKLYNVIVVNEKQWFLRKAP